MPFQLSASIVLLRGAPDGSAGIAVSADAFIGASDEVNLLQLHSFSRPEAAVRVMDLNQDFPGFPTRWKKNERAKESDLESAVRVGERIYWIGSHSLDSDGEVCPERRVFFATRLISELGAVRLEAAGKVYQGLLEDLLAEEALADFRLAASAEREPKQGPADAEGEPVHFGGLNIECLGSSPDGEILFIGFRNPIPQGKALLMPLLNAGELIEEGSLARAHFGEPVLLELHGLGLRDMVWWRGSYLLIAGHYDEHLEDAGAPRPALFRWSGNPREEPVRLTVAGLEALNPEALVVFPDDRLVILSDDGSWTRPGGRKSQKEELKKDPGALAKLVFRSVELMGESGGVSEWAN